MSSIWIIIAVATIPNTSEIETAIALPPNPEANTKESCDAVVRDFGINFMAKHNFDLEKNNVIVWCEKLDADLLRKSLPPPDTKQSPPGIPG